MRALSSCFEVLVNDRSLHRPLDDNEAPIEQVLERLASELAVLASTAAQMETVVAGIAARAGASGEAAEELQQLDLVVQHAEALRTYVAGLSEVVGMKAIPIGAALGGVLLGDVKARLSGLAATAEAQREVEFF